MSTVEIISNLLRFRNQIKMYHWKTPTFSKHTVSDKLVEKIDDHIDRFVETLSGGREERPNEVTHLEFRVLNDKTIVDYLKEFKGWLIYDLPGMLYEHESDLLNQRDEILSDLNRGMYLLSMK